MQNVLMIAYDFPPIGASGVQRTIKFAKYLPTFGWRPIILTVDKDAKTIEYADASLLEELSDEVLIYRSRIIEPYDVYRLFGGKHKQGSRESKILRLDNGRANVIDKIKIMLASALVPDAKIGWYPGATSKAKEIFKKHKIDVIYSSSPKTTSHIIARKLARRFNKPWVADLRDPWPTGFFGRRRKPPVLQKLDTSLERSVLFEATRVIVAWPGILDDITVMHKDFNKSKAILITNGFDEEDYKGVMSAKFEQFTICHAGTFYKNRNPESLFKGLALLFEERPKLKNNIRVLFIGISDYVVRELIGKYGFEDVVEHIPYMDHRECVSYLLGSHLLFLNTLENYVPGKLYEYLGTGKPILAIVRDKTTVAEIMKETRSGIVIDPDDSERVKDFILEMYWRNKEGNTEEKESQDESLVSRYSRKELTRRLSAIFDEVVSEGVRSRDT